MSGAKQKKRKGHRRRDRAPKPRLAFLCDTNMTTQLRDEVNAIPGYRTYRAQDLGIAAVKDPTIRDAATRRNVLILTFDRDFTNPVDFKICTHPGVLWIHMSSQRPFHVAPRLRRFLTSPHYQKCKHAIVELRDRVAIVTSRQGLEPEINYYDG